MSRSWCSIDRLKWRDKTTHIKQAYCKFILKFILDFKNKCQQSNIRIIAHSLGASVVNGTLISLDNNQIWKNNGFTIRSVHLLGAAVNSNTPSRNTPFGEAIERVVDKFYNVYDPRDDLLFIMKLLLNYYEFFFFPRAIYLFAFQNY